MIPLRRGMNAVGCSDHRTVSLVSHASKILLKILTDRIETKFRDFRERNQFGFRKGCGTRDAIRDFVKRLLFRRKMTQHSVSAHGRGPASRINLLSLIT